jgi:hypothetical protein
MSVPEVATSSRPLEQLTFVDNALVSTLLPTTHSCRAMVKQQSSKVSQIKELSVELC